MRLFLGSYLAAAVIGFVTGCNHVSSAPAPDRGLWDAHTHISFYGPDALDSLRAYNVVAIRDLGANKLEEILQWRAEVASGKRKGPRIFTSGVILDGPKDDSVNRWTIRTEAEAAHAVDSLAKRRVDFIKTHNGLSRLAYFAILRAARSHNVKVASTFPEESPHGKPPTQVRQASSMRPSRCSRVRSTLALRKTPTKRKCGGEARQVIPQS